MKTTSILCFTALGLLATLSGACASKSEGVGAGSSANTSAVACSADQQAAAFTRMVDSPIKPPRQIAGLDLAGGDSWAGLTIDAAERVNCASTPMGGDETSELAAWGAAQEVIVTYDMAARQVDSYQLNPGYQGTLEFDSRPTAIDDPTQPNPYGRHHYSIGIGRPVLRDGQTFELNWKKACAPGVQDCWDKQATEMFDALMYTYAPELSSTQESCSQAQTCLAKSFATGEAVFGVRPLGIYLYVPSVESAQPAPSTPQYIYGFMVKSMPFSSADLSLKLDEEGPIATADRLGVARGRCTMKLGMPFSSFLSDCVEVLSDANQNALLRKKVLGNAKRTVSSAGALASGTWVLDVAGPNPNFTSEREGEAEPPATSRATELSIDIRTSGKVMNEYTADGTTLTLGGTAAVYREYARLAQNFLHSKMDASLPKFPLGARECLMQGTDSAAWRPTPGCTGMEQFLTPADPSTTTDENLKRVSIGASMGQRMGIKTVLKPGDPMAVFCADPGEFLVCWDDPNANGPHFSHSGSLFAATHEQVKAVLGNGDDNAIPAEARDPQTWIRLYATALVKYLRAAPQRPVDLSDPRFDALTPTSQDITLTASADPSTNDRVIVKYKNKLEIELLASSANVQQMTYR